MKFMKRAMMTILFFTALLTTFHSISGVEARDFSIWLYDQKRDYMDRSSLLYSIRQSSLKKKSLTQFTAKKRLISSEEITQPKTLEEAINWEKYPSKTVVATGYTAGVESTGKTSDHPQYGITYSGIRVKRDLYSTIAADLSVFPIGTILFIPGYGYGVVADKGSAIKGNKIDLYYHTVDEVYKEWGKRKVEVYVVERGDGSITEKELTALNEDETMQVFRQQIIGK